MALANFLIDYKNKAQGGPLPQNYLQAASNTARITAQQEARRYTQQVQQTAQQQGVGFGGQVWNFVKRNPSPYNYLQDIINKRKENVSKIRAERGETPEEIKKASLAYTPENMGGTAETGMDINKQKELRKRLVDYTPEDLPEEYKEPGFFGQLKDSYLQYSVNTVKALASAGEMGGAAIDSETITNASLSAQNKFNKMLAEHPEWEEPNYKGSKWKDPNFYARLVGGGIPTIMASYGMAAAAGLGTAAVTKNPALGAKVGWGAGALFSGSIEAGYARDELLELGAPLDEANRLGAEVGKINGALEMLPVGRAMSKIPGFKQAEKGIAKKIAKEMFQQGISEGSTEAMQEITVNAVAKEFDENRGLFDGALEAFAGGAILGGLVGGGQIFMTPGAKQAAKQVKEDERGIAQIPGKKTKEHVASEITKRFNETEKGIEIDMRLEGAQAGQRVHTGHGIDAKTRGFKSSFPEWLDSELKRKPIVDKVREHLQNGTMPSDKSSNIFNAYKQTVEQLYDKSWEDIKIKKAPKTTKSEETQTKTSPTQTTKQSIKESIQPKKETVQKTEYSLLKDKLKNISRGAREATAYTKQQVKDVQADVITILDNSGLDANDKAKFIKTVKNVQTKQQMEKALPVIEERVGKLAEKAETRNYKKAIQRELEVTKTKKQSGKPVGKYTPEIQEILDVTRQATKLTKEQAKAKIEENIEKMGNDPSPGMAMENEVLSMMIGDSKNLKKLHEGIRQLKESGQTEKQLQVFNRQTEASQKKEHIKEKVLGGKEKLKGRQTTGEIKKTLPTKVKQGLKSIGKQWIFGWDGKMNILDFNSSVNNQTLEKLFSVHDQETKYKELQSKFIEDINAIVSDSYNIKNKPGKVHNKIIELQKEINLGEFVNSVGEKVSIKITRDEIIKRYIEFKDKSLAEAFEEGNNYTKEIKDAMMAELTKEDMAYGDAQLELYERHYNEINEVYRKMYGVNLPKIEFYSPILREGFKTDVVNISSEFLEDMKYRQAVSTGAIKSRQKNILPIKKQGSTRAMEMHFFQTNHFIAWAEKVNELNNVFSDPDVRTAIKEQFPDSVLSEIDNDIKDFASRGLREKGAIPVLDFFRKKFTVGSLMVKPAIAAKQLVSTIAYMEKLGPKQFTLGLLDFWKNPIKNAKKMNEESIFMKERGKNMERDIKAATDSGEVLNFKKSASFINTLMMNVRLGDKGAIYMGFHAMRKAGYSVKEAEVFSNQTQQSSDLSQLSGAQRGGSAMKLFTMYKTSPNQYLRKEINVVRSLFQKDGFSKKNLGKVARTMAIYHFALPMFFQFVASGFKFDRKELERAAILGSLNGMFIAGDLIDGVIRQALGLRVWDMQIPIFTVKNDIQKLIRDVQTFYFSPEEIYNAIEDLAKASEVVGVPATTFTNMGSGINKIAKKDYRQGMTQLLGWTEYSLEGSKSDSEKKAEKIRDELEGLETEEEQLELLQKYKDEDVLTSEVKEKLQEFNLSEKEKKIKNDSLEERAKYIEYKLGKFDNEEEQLNFLKEMKDKKILTDGVSGTIKAKRIHDKMKDMDSEEEQLKYLTELSESGELNSDVKEALKKEKEPTKEPTKSIFTKIKEGVIKEAGVESKEFVEFDANTADKYAQWTDSPDFNKEAKELPTIYMKAPKTEPDADKIKMKAIDQMNVSDADKKFLKNVSIVTGKEYFKKMPYNTGAYSETGGEQAGSPNFILDRPYIAFDRKVTESDIPTIQHELRHTIPFTEATREARQGAGEEDWANLQP